MSSEPPEVKQVIIIRKDLKMRRGKEMAQACHASMAVILNMMEIEKEIRGLTIASLSLPSNNPIVTWLFNGEFKKIVVSVDSEEELLSIYNDAVRFHLPTVLITDSGLTEFNGVPTNTAVAIGPWYSKDIDVLTGNLKLL